MSGIPTESHRELSELVDDVVAGHPEAPERGTPAVWDTLVELGLTTIGVPEDAGGSGGGLDELSVVVEALARHGVREPLAEAATVAWALALAGHEPVPLGTCVCTAATVELPAVPWGRRASHLLLPTGDRTSGLLDLAAAGVTVHEHEDVAGAPLDRVEPGDVEVTALPGAPLPDQIRARLALLRSAALVGASRGAYTLTRAHVRTREQFGKPLLAIPAVASALATMRVQLVQAETALELARERADDAAAALPAAAAARVVCGDAGSEIATAAHQLHGAMGITAEYPLHRLTRAVWAGHDADLPEEQWAELLGHAALDGGEEHLWERLTGTEATGTVPA